jgi:transposase-like protein
MLYSPEFKEEAIRLVHPSGIHISVSGPSPKGHL